MVSYNGLLQGRYYVNDWDMRWTDDEQAKKNSLCRAVNGEVLPATRDGNLTRVNLPETVTVFDVQLCNK